MAQVAPLVVRAVGHRDGARPHGLGALDLLGDDVRRFIPADADELRLAAVLDVALAVRVEVHPLHRVEDPVLRIHHGLQAHGVRGHGRAARRRECLAACRDRPGRRIVGIEIDRRDAQDLAVLDVDEDRTAVGAVGVARDAAAHVGAGLPCHRFEAGERLHEPHGEVIGAVDADLEVFRGVDALEHVEGGREEALGDRLVLEVEGEVRLRVDALAGAHLAVLELHPAALGLVPQAQLRHQILLCEALGIVGVDPRGGPHGLRNAPQQDR